MSDWKFSDFISKDVLFKTPEKGLVISELYDNCSLKYLNKIEKSIIDRNQEMFDDFVKKSE